MTLKGSLAFCITESWQISHVLEVQIMNSGSLCVQNAAVSLQERAVWRPRRTVTGVVGSHCVPLKKSSHNEKEFRFAQKTLKKVALLAVLFEVIFRLIF